jgi:hypothetical protein
VLLGIGGRINLQFPNITACQNNNQKFVRPDYIYQKNQKGQTEKNDLPY